MNIYKISSFSTIYLLDAFIRFLLLNPESYSMFLGNILQIGALNSEQQQATPLMMNSVHLSPL